MPQIKKTKTKNGSAKNHSHSSKRENRSKFFYINKFLFFLILISGTYFIICMNDLSIKGFMLNSLKSETRVLKEKNEKLELKIMALESYENLDKRARDLKMVRVEKLDYIITISSGVAIK